VYNLGVVICRISFILCDGWIISFVDMVTDIVILSNLTTLIRTLSDADIETVQSRKIPGKFSDMFRNIKYLLECQKM
jgi:hypothetical protein